MKITEKLFLMQDLEYRDFHAKLVPNVEKERIIGIRTPELRSFAKELIKTGDAWEFVNNLPHKYFDENQLHVFVLSEMKDYDLLVEMIDKFLPYVDNWATCDQLRPKIFKKNKDRLAHDIDRWIDSKNTYTVRFGIGMVMTHFIDDLEYMERISKIESSEYYINMMVAWYFATALSKQYDYALKYLQNHRLSLWVHNKTIQKARESFRITREQKEYLKILKR